MSDDDTMRRVSTRLTPAQIEGIELLVDSGEFPSKSEAFRAAVRQLIQDREPSARRTNPVYSSHELELRQGERSDGGEF